MDRIETLTVGRVADILVDPLLAKDIGPRLRCVEAEALARLIELMLDSEHAQQFLRAHAYGDDDTGDEHHDLYIELTT